MICRIEAAGCSLLTVHGRRRSQRHHEGSRDYDALKAIRASITIPMFANGGITSIEAADACLAFTQCQGVMSASALLAYPALFCPRDRPKPSKLQVVCWYLDKVRQHGPSRLYPTALRDHLLTMLREWEPKDHHYHHHHRDLWSVLGRVQSVDQLEACVAVMAARQDLPCATPRFPRTEPLPTLREIRYNWTKK
jgi:tRNA-dihydrouridine synthase